MLVNIYLLFTSVIFVFLRIIYFVFEDPFKVFETFLISFPILPMDEGRSALKILTDKPTRERPLGRPTRR